MSSQSRQPATIGVGSGTWFSPSNAASSNDVDASCSFVAGQTEIGLGAIDCGFSVPSSATILGVEYSIEGRQTGGVTDLFVYLLGGIGSEDKAGDEGVWTGIDETKVYGGPTDGWGASLTPTHVNASSFGVNHDWQGTGGDQMRVDRLGPIIVYYTVYRALEAQTTAVQSVVTGSMSVDRKMVGTVDGLSTAAGAAQADKQLAAPAVAAVATVASDVGGLSSNPYTLAGTVDGVSSTTAAMEKLKSMVGTVDAVSVTGTADLEKPKRLLGEAAPLTAVTGAMQADKTLVGAAAAVSVATGDLGITHIILMQSHTSFWLT